MLCSPLSPASIAPRRGAILIVVLAMLALFAIVGLSFVFYSDSQATIARNERASKSYEAEPNPLEAADQALSVILFDTESATNPLKGHSLARSRYGTTGMIPFSGNGPSPGPVAIGPVNIDRTELMNFVGSGQDPFDNNYRRDVPYTFADRNNYWLARQNPTTGAIEIPSYHRPDLFNLAAPPGTGVWDPATDPAGQYKTVRPLPAQHPGFPYPPPNADGTITGDVQNLKFTGGPQHNDSIWIYTGAPIKTWNNKKYTFLVAPLILDLSSRLNVSAVGSTTNSANQGHGPWEIQPGLIPGFDTAALMNLRQQNTVPNERYANLGALRFNKGVAPPFYGRFDVDGLANGGDGPVGASPPMGTSPFPIYPARYENPANFVAAETNHPGQLSPFAHPRGRLSTPHHFGMDEVVRLLTKPNTTKPNWYAASSLSANVNNISSNIATRTQITPFSVSSAWGKVSIIIDNTGTRTWLHAIDLNRPLPDYRDNPNQPYHPENVVPGNPAYARAVKARQDLARDIFIRLAAQTTGIVDGTNAVYDLNTGNLIINLGMDPNNLNTLRQLAQFSANIVDMIDSDDIATSFIWNPVANVAGVDPHTDVNNFTNFGMGDFLGNHVVFGTELPRLVVNEAYCQLVNNRQDEMNPVPGNMGQFHAALQMQKKYFIELHNPLNDDSQLSEVGAARLKWEPGVSPNLTATGNYAGDRISPYRIEVLEEITPGAFTTYLASNPPGVLGDPGGLDGMGIPNAVQRIRYNEFVLNSNAAANMARPTGDALNVVQPAHDANGVPKAAAPTGNVGYYVLGPNDNFPGGVDPTLKTDDPPAMPMDPVQSLAYDVGQPTDGMGGNIETQRDRRSTVVLQRLANPYRPEGPDNPYITVDYVESIPTRDRVLWTTTDRGTPRPQNNDPTVGRIHPYAHRRGNVPMGEIDLVVNQGTGAMNPATPEHTFFAVNTGVETQNVNGLAWLAHFDRELVNSLDLLQVHAQPPYLLTQNFHNGQPVNGYQAHNNPPFLMQPFRFRALDLLSTKSRYVGTPIGGRIPGQLNINTITDLNLFNALLNPTGGSTHDSTYVTNLQANVTTSRNSNPFWSAHRTNNFEQTLFRSAPGSMMPTLFEMINNPTVLPTAIQHPYSAQEPARRMWNNITTTSDGFLVLFTVGVFEVTDPTGGPGGMPRLGAEMFKSVKGDLRQQFAAVVDRSMMSIDTVGSTTIGREPWEVDLAADAELGSTTITVRGFGPTATSFQVYRNGQPVTVNANEQIHLGFGAASNNTGDGETLTISAIAAGPEAGTVTLTLTTSLSRFHGAGSPVRNTILGNPGPQPNFSHRDRRYHGVLPYFTRIDP